MDSKWWRARDGIVSWLVVTVCKMEKERHLFIVAPQRRDLMRRHALRLRKEINENEIRHNSAHHTSHKCKNQPATQRRQQTNQLTILIVIFKWIINNWIISPPSQWWTWLACNRSNKNGIKNTAFRDICKLLEAKAMRSDDNRGEASKHCYSSQTPCALCRFINPHSLLISPHSSDTLVEGEK